MFLGLARAETPYLKALLSSTQFLYALGAACAVEAEPINVEPVETAKSAESIAFMNLEWKNTFMIS
jgi:hypothetical protein